MRGDTLHNMIHKDRHLYDYQSTMSILNQVAQVRQAGERVFITHIHTMHTHYSHIHIHIDIMYVHYWLHIINFARPVGH